jgi:hypothetical protein
MPLHKIAQLIVVHLLIVGKNPTWDVYAIRFAVLSCLTIIAMR